MKLRNIFIAGLAAGAVLLAPAAAFAEDGSSTNPAPPTKTTAPTTPQKPTMSITLTPSQGKPGQRIEVSADCGGAARLSSPALDFVGFQGNGTLHAVVRDVKPGKYEVTGACTIPGSLPREGSTSFTVLGAATSPQSGPSQGKQVAKVPAGAPQTGGGGTSGEGSDLLVAAMFGVGTLALAGTVGAAAYRRRRAADED
jgi:hypothetical protein